jgi:hypothetical protein
MHAQRVHRRCRLWKSTEPLPSFFLAEGALLLRLRSLAITGLVIACSCERVSLPRQLASTVQTDADGREIVTLSHSPNAIARGAVQTDTLEPDLTISASKLGVRSIADIAPLHGGRFAVLDRVDGSVHLFEKNGTRTSVLRGREATPESLLRWPIGMVNIGQSLVVWGLDSAVAFQILDASTLHVKATAPRRVRGDWTMLQWREPYLGWEPRGQFGPEDGWRRLQAISDTTFALYLQASERDLQQGHAVFDPAAPPAAILRYTLRGDLLDTVQVLVGAASTISGEGVSAPIVQPLFMSRPVWAVGEGWVAYGSGRNDEIEITRSRDEARPMAIRWPAERSAVSDEDAAAAALWSLYYAEAFSTTLRERYSRTSRAKRNRLLKRIRSTLPFSEHVPAVSALYADGHCLWIAGHAPQDALNGPSQTLVALSTLTGDVVATIRLNGHALRPRRLNGTGFYASAVSPIGELQILRFPIPRRVRSCGNAHEEAVSTASIGGRQR